jgi:hypothetical protein
MLERVTRLQHGVGVSAILTLLRKRILRAALAFTSSCIALRIGSGADLASATTSSAASSTTISSSVNRTLKFSDARLQLSDTRLRHREFLFDLLRLRFHTIIAFSSSSARITSESAA